MRVRAILMVAAVAGMAPAAPLHASPGSGQRVEGSIKLAMAHPVYADGCIGLGAQYQIAWLHQPALNGFVGYQFEIDERTWGKRFKLEPLDEMADLDIAFFPRFFPGFVTEDYVDYGSRRRGGESGIVPEGMHEAIVCLHTGADVEFVYRAAAR